MNDHDLVHIRDQGYNHSEVGFERHRPRQQQHHHHPNNHHQHSQQSQQQQPRTSRRQRSTSTGRSRQPIFQVRASNFVKKLTSKFGAGARIKQAADNTSEDADPDAALAVEHYPFRKARSMDVLRSKPYMSSPMLAVTGFDPQSLARKSADGSHESGSANGSDAGELKSVHSRNLSDSNSSSIAQGLAVAAMVAEATSLRPASPSASASAALHPEGSEKRRTPNGIASLSNGADNIPTKTNNMNYTGAQNTDGLQSLTPPPPVPEKRPGHPRLSTLPPLTLHVKGMSQDSRPQRFSPSVIVRPPPFPILELPALPTPIAETSGSSGSQSQSRSRRGTARLNSMPMLPREGSDARENDPDHENCALDEDEEGDDEDNEDDGAATGENDAAGSEEDEDENEAGVNGQSITYSSSSTATPSPTASFFSRTRALSPRLQLPTLNTPSLSSLLGNFTTTGGSSQSQAAGSGTGGLSASASHVGAHVGSTTQVSAAAEPINVSRDDETTPKAVRANHIWVGLGNGSARFDYFSTSGALSRAAAAGAASTSASSRSGTDREIDKTFHVSSDDGTRSSSSSFITSTAPSPLQMQTPTARDHPASQTPMISVAPPPWSPSETSSSVFGSETSRAFKDASFSHTKGAVAAGSDVPHLASIPIRGVADGQQTLKRPSIYHHASKSMIELFSTAASQTAARTAEPDEDADTFGRGASDDHDVKKGKGKLLSEEGVESKILHSLKAKDVTEASGPAPNTNDTLLQPTRDRQLKVGQWKKGLSPTPTTAIAVSGDAAAASPTAATLRRQRSMPTFSTSGPPPPYPSFLLPEHLRRFAPLPRDDEGKEELPPYSNDIRLAAIMPRKMEFSAPGVPARDRKWRRVHCVLEGTAFRVYDAPPRVTGVSVLGGWWERKVGVGDVSSGLNASAGATAGPGATTNIVIGRKEPKRRMKWEEELQAEEEDARRASAESGTEEGQPRASVSSSRSTVELNGSAERGERERERPQAHKSKLHLAASLLHPSRSRLSLAHGSSSSPASPRSSFQSPRNSAEGSSPPSARPSVDLSTTPASPPSQSTALSSNVASSTSALSSSLSAHSSNSDASCTQTRRRRHLRSDSAQSSNNSHSRSNSRAQSPLNPDNNTRSQAQSQNSSHSYSHSATSHLYHEPNRREVPEPDERDLLCVYSLQRAESGLASDYTKRKNVVRVRMEGEQFLLQCKDVASVVEWIEALQAATNIALDLDERPMPKGPIFPRRRRRRRVQPTETGAQTQSTSAADSGGNANAGTVGAAESSAAS
ncbi:hypothetical protein A7U60_g6329 [Sanghuangporus baumii]|uniref:PH domain-containing protein n=1 Tax=Sanghuangporus baumii TaxID=108892 RepID=A0A9Q5HV90_SANBA|nr:hypothetical protein A7U60_g6329 [Sanghuangporus baumii]